MKTRILVILVTILFAMISVPSSASAAVCMDEKFFSTSGSIQFLASDDAFLYAGTGGGRIIRVNKTDRTSQDLATIPTKLEQLILDRGVLFYVTSRYTTTNERIRQIYSLPAAGGTPTLIGEVSNAVGKMNADDTSLFWIVPSAQDQANGKLQKLSRTGGSAQTLLSNLANPVDLAVDASNVYFTEAGISEAPPYGLRKIAKTGGTVRLLTSDRAARLIAGVDATYVYFSAKDSPLDDRLFRVPIAGGTQTPLIASPIQAPSQIELSGGKILYVAAHYDWSNSNTGSVKVIEANGTIVTLSDIPTRGFTFDSTAMYVLPGVSATGYVDRLCLNYATAPRVDSIDGFGASSGGTLITITGERFQNGLKVVFDGTEGTVLSVTPTRIEVRTPPHTPGIATLYVINPDGQSGRATFYVTSTGSGRKRAVHK